MKITHCPNCGASVNNYANFCPNCGKEISSDFDPKTSRKVQNKEAIAEINRMIRVKNNQTSITKKAWYSAGVFLIIIIVAFMDLDSLPIHPAIVMISIFFFIMSIIIGFMFRSREKKLQTLISGENLLAAWTLSPEQKKKYVNYLFKQEIGKNQIILFSISFIAIIVFGLFILFIDEGKLAMFLVLIGLIVFLSLFAFGMPYYYRYKNSKADGKILIGKKYAYINGYFHNWDFPLSGISKVKKIEKPFYGLYLSYYYTDRTFKHNEELYIPVAEDYPLDVLLENLSNKS